MNYYNEFDHNAAEWLRQLIEDGLIPKGEVDERSIADVRATELVGYTQCHFFAGISGWPLALQLAGWPEDRPVWTGSCPCQAFSTAGKQLGFADERDLWPVFRNLIAECRPDVVFGEQVENAIKHGWLDRVYADMERENYACGSVVLGAHSVGAPHRRYRLYWGGFRVANDVSRRFCAGGEFRGVEQIHQSGADVAMQTPERGTCGGVAEDSDGRGCGGRHDGDLAGSGRQIQTAGLGGVCGVEYSASHRRDARRAESDGGSVASGCAVDGVADDSFFGVQTGISGSDAREKGDARELINGYLSSLPPWSNSAFIYCRDNKIRRVPAESLLLGVADGVSEGVDGIGIEGISETGGFPLTTQKEGRAMLLKGYGNAIVPQVAAEFIKAFMAEME